MAKNPRKIEATFKKLLEDRDTRIRVTTKSFEWFFLFYFHEHITCDAAPFHQELFEIAEDDSIKLAIVVAFRGSAKSTILNTAYALWSIMGRQRMKYVVLSGQTEENGRQSLLNIKEEMENNALLKEDLGPFFEERNQWGSTALLIRKFDAKIVTRSVDQHIRGIKRGRHRPDLVILDDIEDTSSTQTKEGRDKTHRWLTGEVIPAGDLGTRVIALGNLLHPDSLLQRLRRQIDSGERDGIYREYAILDADGKPTWPGRYPTLEYVETQRRKIGDPVAWAREFLLKIISPDEQIIKREWIQTYKELPPTNANVYHATGIDLAIKTGPDNDYTAMVSARVCGRRENMRIYILPNIVNKRLTSLEALQHAKEISRTLGHGKLFVEDVQYQYSLVEHLRRENYPAQGVKLHGKNKASRLGIVSFLVQDGKVLFPEQGAEELINQLTGFGLEGHDDLSDAFSLLLSEILEYDHMVGGTSGGTRYPPREEDMLNLSSREKHVIMERYNQPDRVRPDAI